MTILKIDKLNKAVGTKIIITPPRRPTVSGRNWNIIGLPVPGSEPTVGFTMPETA